MHCTLFPQRDEGPAGSCLHLAVVASSPSLSRQRSSILTSINSGFSGAVTTSARAVQPHLQLLPLTLFESMWPRALACAVNISCLRSRGSHTQCQAIFILPWRNSRIEAKTLLRNRRNSKHLLDVAQPWNTRQPSSADRSSCKTSFQSTQDP